MSDARLPHPEARLLEDQEECVLVRLNHVQLGRLLVLIAGGTWRGDLALQEKLQAAYDLLGYATAQGKSRG